MECFYNGESLIHIFAKDVVMKFEHVMIDLETLGINYDSIIVSIGAVLFDPDTSMADATFYERVEWVHDQPERLVSRDTIEWWLTQDRSAQRELTDHQNRIKLSLALHRLDDFVPKGARVWANGATFDIVMLDHAYRTHCHRNPPWGFRNVRDCRTIKELAEPFVDFNQFIMNGTSHNALDDAIFQAEWTSAAWQALRQKGTLND